jgi:hypothetical protein
LTRPQILPTLGGSVVLALPLRCKGGLIIGECDPCGLYPRNQIAAIHLFEGQRAALFKIAQNTVQPQVGPGFLPGQQMGATAAKGRTCRLATELFDKDAKNGPAFVKLVQSIKITVIPRPKRSAQVSL